MRAAKAQRPRRRRLSRETRRALWWDSPAFVAVAIYAAVLAGRTAPGQAVLQRSGDGLIGLTAALGLLVTDIEVEGRETTDPATIMAALGATRGTPILAVSPGRARAELQALPWVRSASIERRLPGTLFVRLVERRPLAVWQHGGKQELIDRDGEVIPVADLSRFARLPTVVGEGAAPHARALIDMLASEPDLAARVTAAIWVGGRRWTLRIDRAIDVYLPETDPAGAWVRLAELERSDALLRRDVRVVDMRLPDRMVIRANATAAPKDPTPAKKPPHTVGKNT